MSLPILPTIEGKLVNEAPPHHEDGDPAKMKNEVGGVDLVPVNDRYRVILVVGHGPSRGIDVLPLWVGHPHRV